MPYAIHAVLADDGIQFTDHARHKYAFHHIFDRVCDENGIEHGLTKVKHPWTNGQSLHGTRAAVYEAYRSTDPSSMPSGYSRPTSRIRAKGPWPKRALTCLIFMPRPGPTGAPTPSPGIGTSRPCAYKAEEVREAFTTWDETLGYWRGNEGMHEQVRLAFDDPVAIPLQGAWSLLWFSMRWNIRFARAAPAPLAGKAMGGDNHVLALLHRDRFAGWSETPDAAITYMRALYEAQARI